MPDKSKFEKLKEELQEALEAKETDYDRILFLSTEIAKFDANNVRFTVDAGHIDRLGKELVGKPEIAVAELVKNAYDADAKEVSLVFEQAWYVGGKLTITDNGTGMTRDELINGFMRISSADKVNNPLSRIFKRQRAGRKGIGRFAVQKLGKKLTIITQTSEMTEAIKVNIDWTKFEKNKEIGTISSQIESTDKLMHHGTILVIEQLNGSWSDADIKRAYRYVSKLIRPAHFKNKLSIENQENTFSVSFYRTRISEHTIIADEQKMIFDQALAKITATIDAEGNVTWGYDSKHFGKEENFDFFGKDKLFDDKKELDTYNLKNIFLEAYYFIPSSGFHAKQDDNRITELLKQEGGIKLYRNGFRVSPYGDQYDDWLGLDASSDSRVFLPPYANRHFMGVVEVLDLEGQVFEERSSREGLLENTSLTELKEFIYKVLLSVVFRIAAKRGRKIYTGQEDWEPKPRIKPHEQVQETVMQLQTAFSNVYSESTPNNEEENDTIVTAAISNEAKTQIDSLLSTLNEQMDEVRAERQREIDEIAMLRVLAGMGVSIGEFSHEVRHYSTEFKLGMDRLHKDLISTQSEMLSSQSDTLNKNLDGLLSYIRYFDANIAANVQRELCSIDLLEQVELFIEKMQPIAHRQNIQLIVEPFTTKAYTLPMHVSEWGSILINLFTNSVKAISRANTKKRIIKYKIGKLNNNIYFEILDTGDGIPVENYSLVFEPFFTTSAPTTPFSTTQQEISGTGLGLKIVKDIITSYNGTISITEPDEGFSTKFHIEIPQA